MIPGYSKEVNAYQLIRSALTKIQIPKIKDSSSCCEIQGVLPCEAGQCIDFFGRGVSGCRWMSWVYFISATAWINLFLPAILVQIIEFMCT